MSEVEVNLHELKKIGVKFIDFTGGEPLLHEDLAPMLTIAKKLKFLTSVTTNCLAYPKNAFKLRGMVDFLHFSLDSHDPTMNKKLRGVDSYSYVMQSIDMAQRLGERPDILFTITDENYTSIEPLSKLCKEKRIVLIVNPVFDYRNQTQLSKETIHYLDRFRFKPYVYINMALHKLIKNGGNSIRKPRCKAITSTIVITPDNMLRLPCFHHRLIDIPIQSSLTQILKSDEYNHCRKHEGTFTFCNHCTINCYFDPSFTYKLDSLFVLSLFSKAKYVFDKKIRTALLEFKHKILD